MHMRADKTIRVLQAGRALAALAVVASHTVLTTQRFVEEIPDPVEAVITNGYLGVDFFFVLSGFIIYLVNHRGPHDAAWAGHYAGTRLLRIYAPYLPIAVAMALFYTTLPQMAQGGQPWSWWATLTLIPFGSLSTLGVAWTLTYELGFYLLALLFFRSGRPLLCAGLWAATIVLRQWIGGPFEAPVDLSVTAVFLHPINLEFVFGMLAAHAILKPSPRCNCGFWTGAVLALCAFLLAGGERENSWLFGLSLACLLVPLVRAERAGRLWIPGIAVALGNASYAIYLVHLPLMSLVARFNARIDPLDHWETNILIGLFTAAVAGLAYHQAIEKPLLRFGKRWMQRDMRSRDRAHAHGQRPSR